MARDFNFSANREQSKTSLDSAEVQPKIEGRAFKDSGIEWIGQIPKEWEVPRLKNVAELHGRIGWNGLRSDEFEEAKSDELKEYKKSVIYEYVTGKKEVV